MTEERWLLPQYGMVTVVDQCARLRVHSVRSIVAIQLSLRDGLVLRLFGVNSVNLSYFFRNCFTFLQEFFVWEPSSHRSELAFRSPPTMALFPFFFSSFSSSSYAHRLPFGKYAEITPISCDETSKMVV